MQPKKILILGGADFQIPFIEKAQEYGLYVGVVDINANAAGKEYADEFFQASVKDVNSVLEIAKAFRPNGITVGMVDIAIPAYAYTTTFLNIPGIDVNTAIKATNKYEMIKAFEKGDVPHPLFQYIRKDRIGIEPIIIEYPLIVKPIDMAGSRGIFLVNNDEEMNIALHNSSEVGDSGDILIEEYMEGPEVSVELIVKNKIPHVIQITDKTTSGAPHFAETGHLQPSQLDKKTCNAVIDVASRAATSLGLENSLGHAEVKITKDGPKMVEIGARAGGDAIGEQLIELSTGVSFPEIAIKIALGEEFDIPTKRLNKSSCIRFITTRCGILSGIEGVDKAKKIPGVKLIKIFGSIGKKYEDMIDSSGRLGYIITQADDALSAKKICDMAFNKIKITYTENRG